MMSGGILPALLNPFTLSNAVIATWPMVPSFGNVFAIGSTFDIPVDMDRTVPVTIVVHMLIDSTTIFPGNQAALALTLDVAANNTLVGTIPPATSPDFIFNSPDFTVTPAIPPLSLNLRQVEVSIPLDLSTSVGDWAFLTVERTAPATNEFFGIIYCFKKRKSPIPLALSVLRSFMRRRMYRRVKWNRRLSFFKGEIYLFCK